MRSIDDIAKDLYDTCYTADRYISNCSEIDAKFWAKANSVRHAHTVRMIEEYCRSRNKADPRILNLSGISCGHQDFSINPYLKKIGLIPEWIVFDSPNNPYQKNPVFKEYLSKSGVKLILCDFSKEEPPLKDEEYDIVIFTEIAEHLDHSVLLNMFTKINKTLKRDGILILTTPNLVRVVNRIRTLLGDGDGVYLGDGQDNLANGIFGHVANYDIKRLNRLLEDSSFKIEKRYTFDYGWGPEEKYPLKRAIIEIVKLIGLVVPNSKANIMIVARKAERRPIPLKVV